MTEGSGCNELGLRSGLGLVGSCRVEADHENCLVLYAQHFGQFLRGFHGGFAADDHAPHVDGSLLKSDPSVGETLRVEQAGMLGVLADSKGSYLYAVKIVGGNIGR